jgi:hypothetical protein
MTANYRLDFVRAGYNVPYIMNEQPEQNARPELDQHKRAPGAREQNELELSRSPVRDEKTFNDISSTSRVNGAPGS